MQRLRRIQILTVIAAAVLATGCSTTDDPSKGGLIGYWTHGEDAYQRRLEERQALLEQARARSAATEEETAELEARLAAKQEELKKQQARLERLRDDIEGLEKESDTMGALTEDAQKERQRLQQDLATLQEETQALASAEPVEDVSMEEQIRERQKRIAALEKELKALRERASLLTTL